ncbi:MAG: molybdopterin-containing oxidoreductase family protein, partial [Chloroflexota bacterium]
YHPDRIRQPMRLIGSRGSGNYEPIRWDDAINELVRILDEAAGEEIYMLSEPLSGAVRQVSDRFINGLGGTRVTYQTLEQANLRAAIQRVFGSDQLPYIDLGNAQYALSFGADFLHSWISPVNLSRGFGQMRRHSEESPRGTLVHVESRLSGTATSADRWLPVRPGYEGMVALAIAGVIVDEGMVDDTSEFESVMNGTDLPSPEDVAEQSGIDAETIREVAQQFAESPASVAFGGGSAGAYTNGVANLTAIYALNLLAGNVNSEGGIYINSNLDGDLEEWGVEPAATAGQMQSLIQTLNDGGVGALLLHQANPVYGLPSAMEFDAALRRAGSIISFSRYLDETSVFADLILPDHVPLESWGSMVPDPMPGYPTIGFQQPVVLRFYDTYQFGDVLLSAAEELGLAEDLPWATMEEVVREQAEVLREAGGGNISATGNTTEFWTELIQTGAWMDEEAEAPAAEPDGGMPDMADPQYGGDEGEFPFHLVPFESVSLGAGEFAHLPWMQSLPDPITTVAWASWVELNRETAEDLDVSTGDYARVISPVGELDVRVYVNRATPPNVVSIPMGQGHTFGGRYSEGRGINVLDLLDPLTDEETGSLAWASTRVRLERVGSFEKLPVLEGVVEAESPDDYEIIRKTSELGDE